jgi:hypothetical protein
MSLRVIDGQTGEMFAIGELLNSSLQSALRVSLKIMLNVAGKALSQHFGATIQVPSHLPSQDHNLIRRSTQGDKGHANDERDDKPGAE